MLRPHLRQSPVYAEIAFDSNPTNLSQFNTTSDGVNYKKLVDFNAVYNTTLCWNADISSLNVLAAKDGANATLVVVYATETSTLYQVGRVASTVARQLNVCCSALT